MSIYENPEEYAKYCHIPLKLATDICDFFISRQTLSDKVVCPNCGSKELSFDGDGGDYSVDRFISCIYCSTIYHIDDERLKAWVENSDFGRNFDEVLWLGREITEKGLEYVEHQLGEKWVVFSEKTTEEMLSTTK